MRILLLSDLHHELYSPVDLPGLLEQQKPDCLVLAGDVNQGWQGLKWILQAAPRSLPVIYVLGNHEHYGHAWPKLAVDLKAEVAATPGADNVHVLEKDSICVDRVRFLGTTLWTDMCLWGAGELQPTMSLVRSTMNDYRRIRHSGSWSKLRPQDTRGFHLEARRWLVQQLQQAHDGPTVVVTHHAPARGSIGAGMGTDSSETPDDPIWAAYVSDMEATILQYQPTLWLHGHTHCNVDYTVGATRVATNQRGHLKGGVYQPGLVDGLTFTV